MEKMNSIQNDQEIQEGNKKNEAPPLDVASMPKEQFIPLIQEHQKRDNARIAAIKSELGSDVSAEEISGLSPEQKERAASQFQKLKEVLEREDLDPAIKEMLIGAEVSAVIAGIKPASYLQPRMEKKFLGFVRQAGISEKALQSCVQVLREFGIQSAFRKNESAIEFKKENGIELMQIYDEKAVLTVMRESGLFSVEEIAVAEKDMGAFFTEYMSTDKIGIDALRVGALYGYPVEDVSDYWKVRKVEEGYRQKGISKNELRMRVDSSSPAPESRIDPADSDFLRNHSKTTSMSVKGTHDSVDWQSYSPHSKEVQKRVRELEETFALEREILSK